MATRVFDVDGELDDDGDEMCWWQIIYVGNFLKITLDFVYVYIFQWKKVFWCYWDNKSQRNRIVNYKFNVATA